MKSPDDLLADGARSRLRRDEYTKTLAVLKYRTTANRWGGLGYILVAGFLGWLAARVFLNDEPMTKSDGFILVVYTLGISSQLYMGISQVFRDPRDAALRNLIEEKLREEEKE